MELKRELKNKPMHICSNSWQRCKEYTTEKEEPLSKNDIEEIEHPYAKNEIGAYTCHRRSSTTWFLFHKVSDSVKLLQAVNTIVVIKGWWVGEMGSCCLMGIKFHLC